MFNKLRNRFLLLNLAIISITIILAFISIYFITYKNVYTDINIELRKLSEFDRRLSSTQLQNPALPPKLPDIADKYEDTYDSGPERSISFNLYLNEAGEIETVSSFLSLSDEFYNNALKAAISAKKETGTFSLDDNYWIFLKTKTASAEKIVFMEITARQAILTNLIYTFLIVLLVMLVIIYFIARFFANKSIKPVKDAFYKQKQFVADASHELKTPLAVISTNVDVLLSNGEETVNSQSKWLQYIKSETERMSKLTGDLLYLTQVDSAETDKIFSLFNLSDNVENILLTMEAVVYEHKLNFKYKLDDGLMAYGSSEQISQVVVILMDNAIKYSTPGGVVELILKKQQNLAILSVSNTGEAISPEHLGKIFDRFYRADQARSRKNGGYGLGLAIAKAIVEQHRGKISVKSSVADKTTTFTVEIPLQTSSLIK